MESWELEEGAVPSTGTGTLLVLVLLPELDAVVLSAALPQAGGLQDLLHQLLEGALDSVSRLSARLLRGGETQKWGVRFRMESSHYTADRDEDKECTRSASATDRTQDLLLRSQCYPPSTDRKKLSAGCKSGDCRGRVMCPSSPALSFLGHGALVCTL